MKGVAHLQQRERTSLSVGGPPPAATSRSSPATSCRPHRAMFRPVLKGQRVRAVPLSAFSAVKAYAKRAGLDAQGFAGHSLRSGFLTSAAEAGASVFKMMEVSRHRSVDVLRGYVRRADLFHEHTGATFLCLTGAMSGAGSSPRERSVRNQPSVGTVVLSRFGFIVR